MSFKKFKSRFRFKEEQLAGTEDWNRPRKIKGNVFGGLVTCAISAGLLGFVLNFVQDHFFAIWVYKTFDVSNIWLLSVYEIGILLIALTINLTFLLINGSCGKKVCLPPPLNMFMVVAGGLFISFGYGMYNMIHSLLVSVGGSFQFALPFMSALQNLSNTWLGVIVAPLLVLFVSALPKFIISGRKESKAEKFIEKGNIFSPDSQSFIRTYISATLGAILMLIFQNLFIGGNVLG